MRLNSLSKHDAQTAKAILSAAALANENGPYFSANVDRYQREALEVVEEIRQKLNVDASDEFGRAAIQSALSEQVVAAIMGDQDTDEVTKRMGLAGRLPVSAYKIRFRKHFEKEMKESEKYIGKVIASATDIQHLQPSYLPEGYSKGVTLIVSHQESRQAGPHLLLIDAMRVKDELFVDRAFRIFPKMVELAEADSPLDVLKAFVDVYGFHFSIEGLEKSKFYEQILFAKSEDQLHVDLEGSPNDSDVTVSGSAFAMSDREARAHKLPVSGCVVIMAYGIDMYRYQKDRRKFMGGLAK